MNPIVLTIALLLVRQQSPEQAVNELLAADLAFSAASARTDLVSGIGAMLAPDVIMPAPGGVFLEGEASVREALSASAPNLTSRATWTPIRGGISADGRHGFTYGYMTIVRADSTRAYAKYMSYWVKRAQGWRVQVYKRSGRELVDVDTSPRVPSLPARLVAPTDADHRASLAAAEAQFSAEAQSIGLGAAFAKFGSADAVNMGPPASAFVFGADSIAKLVGGNGPAQASPVVWAADHRVIVASSGDLGITMGFIHQHAKPAGPPFAFFTIWRRAGPDAPWRYIAE